MEDPKLPASKSKSSTKAKTSRPDVISKAEGFAMDGIGYIEFELV
jgi:hypothetical protein